MSESTLGNVLVVENKDQQHKKTLPVNKILGPGPLFISESQGTGRYVCLDLKDQDMDESCLGAYFYCRKDGPFDIWTNGFERFHFGIFMIQISPSGEVKKEPFRTI